MFDRDKVLLDFPIQQLGILFEAGSYAYLNHAQKVYCVHSYSDQLARIYNWPLADRRQPHDFAADASAGLTPTGKTAVVGGFNATQFVRTNKDTVEWEIWICEDCGPTALRTVGEEIRRLLPLTYWSDESPSLVQTILVFGVPLRIVEHGREPGVIEAVPMQKKNLDLTLLEIPPEYIQCG